MQTLLSPTDTETRSQRTPLVEIVIPVYNEQLGSTRRSAGCTAS